ncbi:hypothetical protein PENFLA_c007G00108 [Penicillium flavigenum]|uniref:Chorismate-utilising enzyme C-terminal domain-containing protein n=1 Tax=Penicillium flavigenum TaxID=254877 RepID=A0A1V6TKU5_9EURO|nr:hypothetical protein PENFLA_c007G00108 [Penicillium flavigenum]
MSPDLSSITFTCKTDTLKTVAMVLANHKNDNYYAYERDEHWYIGLGNKSSLLVDSEGKTVTIKTETKEESYPVNGTPLADISRKFVHENFNSGGKIFGQVAFNYAAHIRGQPYRPGQWPLLSLLVPYNQVVIHRDVVTVTGSDDESVRELYNMIKLGGTIPNPVYLQTIDTDDNMGRYTARVARALSDIQRGQYIKVIPSRAIEIEGKIDMPATLLGGRRSNNPARCFSLSHAGFQATGFSPELVMSGQNGKVITEPLAGTRSCRGTEAEVERLKHELLSDPKEIVEHVLSVKEAIQELGQLCPANSIFVEDLMSVRARGAVQHLGSRVAGTLSPDKDVWDALAVLFPSITASGIPKNAAIDAIQHLEHQSRELYSGAVLMIEDPHSFEAALVLRTVFQDPNRQWIQAGAGVISQSNPQRELTETCEKLASIAPFVASEASF